jgi:pheromone shutdown protein TraB
MQHLEIVLISTVHHEIGKCNPEELYKIIESINPDVIFLEAFEDNYTKYDQMKFSQFGIYNERLELKTLQKYRLNHFYEYVPVLDIGLSNEFEEKIKIVSENMDYKRLFDKYTILERDGGFEFLNSTKSVELQEEMRQLENHIIDNEIFHQKVNENIDEYENSMLRNIYSFYKEKYSRKAIFMCGAAHRKSISEKIKKSEIKLNWSFYNETI